MRTLEAKAGTTPRQRGSGWVKTRSRILLRDQYTCRRCGAVSQLHEVDHITPLEQGGSNADCNLQTLCRPCHRAKTEDENRMRAGG